MNNLEQYIKYHIDLEFYYKNNEFFIFESSRHIDNIEKWTSAIYKKLLNFVNSHTNNISFEDKLHIFKSDISNIFFDKCIITINYIPNDSVNNIIGSYNLESSGLYDNNEYVVFIDLTIIGNLKNINKLSAKCTIAHELAHAYVEYNKNHNITITNKIQSNHINQSLLIQGIVSNDIYIKRLCYCIYFSLKEEVQARQNEIYYEIYSKRISIRDRMLANDIIKNTKVYANLITCEQYFDDLKHIDDNFKQNCLNVYNKIFNCKIINYESLLNDLESKIIYARNKIIDAAASAASIAYKFRNSIDINNI